MKFLAVVSFTLVLSCLSHLALAYDVRPYADLTMNTRWDSQYQEMEPMDLVEVSQAAGVKSFRLAFITDSGICAPAWGGQTSYSVGNNWGSHLTDKLHEKKINYDISLGGAIGNDLSTACTDTQLIDAYENIIKIYHPEGLDFDIENGSAKVDRIMSALQVIQKKYPAIKISFTLPVMPEGLVASGEDILKQAHAAHLIFTVNIMAMDYGPAYVNDMGAYAAQAATRVFEFLKKLFPDKTDAALWQMIEVTPMIGVNDVNVEQFTLKNVDTLKEFARRNPLHLLSFWSIARDKPCGDQWASPTCSGNHLQTKPYEFAKRFLM